MGHPITNVAYPLRAQLGDGSTTLFLRAEIFNPAGTSLGFTSLPHISGGLYGANFTFTVAGSFTGVFRVFTDAGFTIPAPGYDRFSETFDVTDALSIPTVAQIADGVWDEVLAGHLTAGTTGASLDLADNQAPTAAVVADAVLDELVNDHLTVGSLGEALALLKGLGAMNFVLDNTTYNGKGLLTAGRVRVFKDRTDAIAEVSPLAVITITGTAEISPNDHLGQKVTHIRDP